MNEFRTGSQLRRLARSMAMAFAVTAMAVAGMAGTAHARPAPGGFTAAPFGNLDQAEWVSYGSDMGFKLRAWAIDPDTTSPVWLRITADGQLVETVYANQFRPDVGAAYPGYGDFHGIDFTVPGSWIPGYGGGYFPSICVTALDTQGE